MKVLIVLEDPTLDQYVVKPIVQRMLAELGRTARVEVLQDPHLRGIDDALNPQVLRAIVADNPMIDLFLLIVDRDCDRTGNSSRVAAREKELAPKLVGCLAREEVEIWMLAMQPPLPAPWKTMSADCDPKERFAEPFLEQHGWHLDVGRGRKRAMDAPGGYARLWSRCRELQDLRRRLEALLE